MTNACQKWNCLVAAAAVVWLVGAGSTLALNAQAQTVPVVVPTVSSGASSGVYTEAQAKRGQDTANNVCADCHGVDFIGGETPPSTGAEPVPALLGPEFLAQWKSVGELFDRIHTGMPWDKPGTLSLQDTADALARILQLNGFPAGRAELPTDLKLLSQIKIDSPPSEK